MYSANSDEEIKSLLPQFISDGSREEFLEDLKKFPLHSTRFYSRRAFKSDSFLQGDGFRNGVIVDISSKQFATAPCLIFSNSCDISADNKRHYTTSVCYAPILSLPKFKKSLINKNFSCDRINMIIGNIKEQKITSILYLPSCEALGEDKIIFMDRLQNYPSHNFIEQHPVQDKMFTLSNFGFYLFLIKLAIHFTRIRDGVDREVESPS